ncbi:Cellulose synthase catalytic subunit [UDP-forming] [Cupriavidus yeoncheonensis]|uniref:Cellulose synthase catalytic subunit [UDP-forming] n=1 Tax=Cupriavidus yeoncheonensis TaxID=1462994 RepID=A0A916ITL7_9BURK|nr:UDP-forming cellulose synthase catalytic subunit [Cupriavidus yeoncheonensis]CAG2141939.1 Cellulose synthase catalytic subunit [UDP-forming] [Cupriavidus yeoncheonensis]
MTLPSASAMFERLRHLLARELGISASAPAGLWWLRLLFRAPPPGRPDLPLRCAIWLRGHARERLGIGRQHGIGIWLQRLLLRPPRAIRPLAADLRQRRQTQAPPETSALRRWFRSWLEPTYFRLKRLRRRLLARLPRVDWNGIAHRLEALSPALGQVPLLMPVLLVLAAVSGILLCTTPLPLHDQFLLVVLILIGLFVLRRIPGRLATLSMAALSVLMAGRYIWWRVTTTLQFETTIEAVFGYLLLVAEFYTWIVLFLGYIQTIWPLNRQPAALPAEAADWPTVDVFIPTYNEPLRVLQPTVYAARSMDWPAGKMRIYVLDDGDREEIRAFAEEAGVHYLARDEHSHAKAGNINSALRQTAGEYVAIFDCDHIPTRSFLQMTMGEFLADPKCAMVQTPHHFFSPDPFERNFDTFRRVPNEGSLFYGLIQDGNDFWNATFFCGSCAVIKRAPLEEIGGIAVETVTEDAHTALKLHRLGYNSAYLRTVQAAGLATENLAGHIGQRIRWARGMAQIFRIDNPMLGKGLHLFQRLCYSNAMLHFFYGIPRLIFLTMPIAYLYFGLHVIHTSAVLIMAYVIPYLLVASITNSRLQGRYRHSFWAEVYESVLAWYIVLPTTMAFINPRLGKFNVTAKGGQIAQDYLDWTISKPYVLLLALNVAGLALGAGRVLFDDSFEPSALVMNMGWATFNLVMLGAAIGVAREARQVRISHRIPMRVPATLLLPDGRTLACKTENYSLGGLGLLLPVETRVDPGAQVGVCLSRGKRSYHFPAVVTRNADRHLGVRFEDMDAQAEQQLIQCTFGRADAWINWIDEQPVDVPLNGLKEVIEMGYQGLLRLVDAARTSVAGIFGRTGPRQP